MDLQQSLNEMIKAGDYQFCHAGSRWVYRIYPRSKDIRISVSRSDLLDEAVSYLKRRELKTYTAEDYLRLFQRLKKRSDKLCLLRKFPLTQYPR